MKNRRLTFVHNLILRIVKFVQAIQLNQLKNSIAEIGSDVALGNYTVIINPEKLKVATNTQIGDFTVLLAQNGIEIGAKCRISTSCMISSVTHKIASYDRHVDDFVDSNSLNIVIGDNVWIGATSVILPGTKIGKNSIISAGSVVKGNVPENEIWGGMPAVYISTIRF